MSILGRLRGRGTERAARAPRTNAAAPGEPGGRIELETFEDVRVGDTALARVGGVLSPGAGRPSDFTLEVSVLGEGSEALRALVEAAPGSQDRWRAAFATRLELVEHPPATFPLLTGGGRIPLDPPLLRELHSAPASDGGLDVLEGRVRE